MHHTMPKSCRHHDDLYPEDDHIHVLCNTDVLRKREAILTALPTLQLLSARRNGEDQERKEILV